MELEQEAEPVKESGGMDAPGSPDDSLFLAGLPCLATGLGREEILRKLDGAARRGRLAGFVARSGEDLFEVEAYSAPFEHVLVARADGTEPRLTFRLQTLRKMPLIFAVVVVLSLWPGLPLT